MRRGVENVIKLEINQTSHSGHSCSTSSTVTSSPPRPPISSLRLLQVHITSSSPLILKWRQIFCLRKVLSLSATLLLLHFPLLSCSGAAVWLLTRDKQVENIKLQMTCQLYRRRPTWGLNMLRATAPWIFDCQKNTQTCRKEKRRRTEDNNIYTLKTSPKCSDTRFCSWIFN